MSIFRRFYRKRNQGHPRDAGEHIQCHSEVVACWRVPQVDYVLSNHNTSQLPLKGILDCHEPSRTR